MDDIIDIKQTLSFITKNQKECQERYDKSIQEAVKADIARIEYLKQERLDRLITDGLSEYHIDLINDSSFDDSQVMILEAKKYYSEYGKHKINNWLFLSSSSGTGKTSALHWTGRMLCAEKNKRVGYIVYGDFMDSLKRGYESRVTIEGLLKYDVLILDDIAKDEKEIPMKDQDRLKRLVDSFLRHNKVLLLGSDISLEMIENRLHATEYRAQICNRIRERCGRFIVGKNDLPDLRLSIQQKMF